MLPTAINTIKTDNNNLYTITVIMILLLLIIKP